MPSAEPILQHHQSACGLAALIMIDHHFGGQITLAQFETLYGRTDRQWSAAEMILKGHRLGLIGNAIELEPAELTALALPCVLHWQLNHFVVLRAIRWGRYIIDDPAIGRINVAQQTLNDHFTGVALTFHSEIRARSGRAPSTSPVAAFDLPGPSLAQLSALFCFLIHGVLQASTPVIIKFILDDIVVSHDLALLKTATFGLFLLLIAAPLIARFQESLMLDGNQHLERGAQHGLLKNLTATDTLRSIDAKNHFKRIKSLRHFSQFYGSEVVRILGHLILAVALTATLFLISPEVGVLMVLTSAVLISLHLWLRHPIASGEKLASNSDQTYVDRLMEFLTNGREIQRYDAAQPFLHRLGSCLKGFHHHQSLAHHRSDSLTLAHQICIGISLSLLLYWIGFQTMAGHMTLGGLYLTLAYRSLLTQHVLSICQLFANADSAKAVRRDLDSRTETSLVSASTKRSPIHPSQPAQERASLLAKAREGKPNGQLQFQQLLNSESFEVVSGASLNASPNPMPKGLNESEQNNGHRPKPLLTAAFTDAIFNTTILANITMMTATPDMEKVNQLIQKMALSQAIDKHPFGLDTVITPEQHRFNRFEKARLILARALYSDPGVLVLELPAVIVADEMTQNALRDLVDRGLTIALMSEDLVSPLGGLELVWQHKQAWLQRPTKH